MREWIKAWGGLVILAGLPITYYYAPGAHRWWSYAAQALGAYVIVRWSLRWVQRRYRSAPGLSGFVPHRAPWQQ